MADKKKIKALQETVETLKEQLALERLEKMDIEAKLEDAACKSKFSSKIGKKVTDGKASVSPSASHSTVLKSSEVKPTSFKGSESEDWLIWLKNYEMVASINNWSNEFKLARLATVLEGDANAKYWECSVEDRSDWDALTGSLTQKFAPKSNRATFQAALETRQRRKEESLDAYMSAIKTLARKAFPEWEDKYRDIMVKKYFIDGLAESFRMWVLQANPESADEALQVALRTEANLSKKEPVAATVNQTNTTADLAEAIAIALEKRGIGNQNQGFPMSHPNTSRGRARGRGRGRQQGRRPGNVVCHSCGQEGHFWRDSICPNSPRNQGNERGTGGWN